MNALRFPHRPGDRRLRDDEIGLLAADMILQHMAPLAPYDRCVDCGTEGTLLCDECIDHRTGRLTDAMRQQYRDAPMVSESE